MNRRGQLFKLKLKLNVLLFSILFFLISGLGQARVLNEDPNVPPNQSIWDHELYDFPFTEPYFATLTNLVFSTGDQEPKKIYLPHLPGRGELALLENRARQFYVSALVQSHPAPVIFLIPGMGAGPQTGRLASELFKEGYSVLSPFSPSHWLFVLAQSQNGLAGNAIEDAKDLHRIFVQAMVQAKSKLMMQPTSFRIAGISLGAVHAAHLWRLDQKIGHFDFQKLIFISPTIHLEYSMRELDRLYGIGETWSQEKKDTSWGKAIYYAEEIWKKLQRREDLSSRLSQLFPMNTIEIQFLIGDNFRNGLRDSIFVFEQIHHTGFFKSLASRFHLNERLNEIKRVGYLEFNRKIAYPFWKEKLDKPTTWTYEDFMMEQDLGSHIPEFSADSRVYFISNLDDFINDPRVSESVAKAFGTNAYLYPFGGHGGNLWFPKNTQDLKRILK